MTDLIPYIMFNGTCAEALAFYKEALNGSIEGMNKYGDMPPSEDGNTHFTEADKDKVMHATLKFNNGMLMASDSPSGNKSPEGSNIHLSLNLHDVNDMDQKFNKLAEGGTITMPPQDTFWGARFGMLQDKFGINWMFNCELNQEGSSNQ